MPRKDEEVVRSSRHALLPHQFERTFHLQVAQEVRVEVVPRAAVREELLPGGLE